MNRNSVYETGNTQVDNEHKEFFQIANWFIDHVLGSDKLTANYYRNWNLGASLNE